LLAILVLAAVAPTIWGAKADHVDPAAFLQGPSSSHLLGTDELGRDIFYRTLVAANLSIKLALLATLIAVVLGVSLGAAPTVLGVRSGRFVSAIVNISIAFPSLLLILFFAVIFGVGQRGAVLALGFASAPFYARLMQTLAASVGGRDFVAAARVAGVGRIRLLAKHIIPNVGEQIAIIAALGAGSMLLAFAALSFLGLGIQPPLYDWGRLLNSGLTGIYQNPLGALGPAAVIVVAGLAFNLVGEAAAQVIGVRTPSRPGEAPEPLPNTAGRVPPAPSERVGTSGSSGPMGPVLAVENLQVLYPGAAGWTRPVRGVTFAIFEGEAVGLVGESGSGKSLTALAVSQLIEEPGLVTADRLEFNGVDLTKGSPKARRKLLGTRLAMVFQDPMSSFNPVQHIGTQLAEVSREHEGLSRKQAMAKAIDRLTAVRVPNARHRAHQYPHEFSGGMRQRAMIAMGLMGSPRLIVADEPTTALDVTVQRQVLRLIDRVRREENAATLLISHDITLVEQTCQRVMVMYAGRIIEEVSAADLHTDAMHPYTRALLGAVPDMDLDRDAPLTVIPGRPPEPSEVVEGCAFAPRCVFATARCMTEDPLLALVHHGHRLACWNPQTGPLVTPAGAPIVTDQAATNTQGRAL
jgi:oligopeptide/dipeptide ABC transporter ATP-binding protein